jgi:hypothetical protein
MLCAYQGFQGGRASVMNAEQGIWLKHGCCVYCALQVPNQASAAFQDLYPAWAAAAASPGGCYQADVAASAPQ